MHWRRKTGLRSKADKSLMKINNEFEKSFKRHRGAHFEQCMLMSEFIYTYKQLHDSMDKYIEQMNLASSFFQTCFRTIRTSAILWIAKAFDDRESSSLYRFLEFVRQNIRFLSIEHKMFRTSSPSTAPWIRSSPEINESVIDSHIDSLNTLLPIVQRIITLRDKYHAHLDRSVINNRKAFVRDNHFTWDELNLFPKKYHEIIEFYSIAYDGESRFTVPINWNDIENLLEPLRANGIGNPLLQ